MDKYQVYEQAEEGECQPVMFVESGVHMPRCLKPVEANTINQIFLSIHDRFFQSARPHPIP